MLDKIYISNTLSGEVKNLLSNNLGKVFGIVDNEDAPLNAIHYTDELSQTGFNVVFTDASSNIDYKDNCDYFQPFKHNEEVKEIDITLFMNLIEYHAERLKLSPVLNSNYETILACD